MARRGWKNESARHSLAARGVPSKSLRNRLVVVPVQYGGTSKNLYNSQVLYISEKPNTSLRVMYVRILPGQKRAGNIYRIEKSYYDIRSGRETHPSDVHNLEQWEAVGERIATKTTQKNMKKEIEHLLQEGYVEKYCHKKDVDTTWIEFLPVFR